MHTEKRERGVALGDVSRSFKCQPRPSLSPCVLSWERPRNQTVGRCRLRMWQSDCGRFRVIWSRSRFPDHPIPSVYYAWILRGSHGQAAWTVFSKHSKRKKAFNACEKAAAALDQPVADSQPGTAQ